MLYRTWRVSLYAAIKTGLKFNICLIFPQKILSKNRTAAGTLGYLIHRFQPGFRGSNLRSSQVLELTDWKVNGKNGAAEILGLKRGTLRARMQKLDIRKP